MPRNENEPLMTVDDVAAKLRVSSKTVRNWVFRGKLPSVKLGGAVRFDRNEIEEWIEEQKAEQREQVA